MKKRKNIILSAITCFVSICLLMIGVYAASSPSVSIGGQVSYTARDARVLVQGKVNGAKGQSTTVDYPSATISANAVTATKVTNSSTQYLDYTAGTGNSEQDVLSQWKIGTLEFAEDNTGVKDITISFKLTNLSTYPVQATLTFPSGATASDLANAKVSRTASATSAYLAQNSGSKEITVTYKLTNDSQNIPDDATNLLGMEITFEKTSLQKANSVSAINENGGKVTMGKQSESSTDEDVEWLCFAYSTDGTTWTKLDSGASIPATAKYGYFVLDTYVSSLDNKDFLASGKYASNGNEYYINAGVNGVATAKTVLANDYYYSDIRQTLKGLETTLSISKDNEIYKAIQGRTIADLYSGINSDGTQLSLPTGANANETDAFWLLSCDELNSLLSKIAWKDSSSNTSQNSTESEISTYAPEIYVITEPYWLRSPYSDYSFRAHYVSYTGVVDEGYVGDTNGARAAFMLELA